MIICLFSHYEIQFCLKIQFHVCLFMSDLLWCLHMTSVTSATQLCDHIVFLLLFHLSVITLFTGNPCTWCNSSLLFSPVSWAFPSSLILTLHGFSHLKITFGNTHLEILKKNILFHLYSLFLCPFHSMVSLIFYHLLSNELFKPVVYYLVLQSDNQTQLTPLYLCSTIVSCSFATSPLQTVTNGKRTEMTMVTSAWVACDECGNSDELHSKLWD